MDSVISRESLASRPKYEMFNVWFRPISQNIWNVVDTKTKDIIGRVEGQVVVLFDQYRGGEGIVAHDFELYKSRNLEYTVNQTDNIINFRYGANMSDLREEYVRKLIGCALLRAEANGADPDAALDKIRRCVDMLVRTDFFTAPASSIYHDSYESGLVAHTLNVVKEIIDMQRAPKFEQCDITSAVLVALVHDWCKIGLYESYLKNVKNEETGIWEQVKAYRRTKPSLLFGHGASSMFIASQYFKLSTEEALAIRWHMGVWNVSQPEQDELQYANENYPLVHLLQFADQLSITSYPTEVNNIG